MAQQDGKAKAHGWCVDGTKVFPGRPREARPSLWQTVQLLPVAWRLWRHLSSERAQGRDGIIDPFHSVPCRQVYGVPLGGLGGGTVGRGWRGDFNRWAIYPGKYTYATVATDQFTVCIRKNGTTVYQKVLFPGKPDGAPASWDWTFPRENYSYRALYPQAWSTYDIPELQIRLICHQVSPVIPNDYSTSSMPAGVFAWTVENISSDDVEVTIMFTFQNGCGEADDERQAGHFNAAFEREDTEKSWTTAGVVLQHAETEGDNAKAPFHMSIAAKQRIGVAVTRHLTFSKANGGDQAVWEHLLNHGKLEDHKDECAPSSGHGAICAAVAATCFVPAGQKELLEFSLCWDLPRVRFALDPEEEEPWVRRYCRFFGSDGHACPRLAHAALKSWRTWVQRINEWQAPVLQNSSTPAWYKSALFNELYFLADGGTLWVEKASSLPTIPQLLDETLETGDGQPESYMETMGRFAYLEGHVYRMYNTLDVAFYASFALATLWPKLQLSVTEHFAHTLMEEDLEVCPTLMHGGQGPRKTKGTMPHDIGSPDASPWFKLNSYNLHNTADWKDLDTKFVLQVFRDYRASGDVAFLQRMWPVCKETMKRPMSQDLDGDGLIENSGFADQTYDAWTVTGPSAYCGGLFLAALRVMVEMAGHDSINDEAAAKTYSDMYQRGQAAYEDKLWNEEGGYYNYDGSGSDHSTSIQADQLAGHWYLRSCGLSSYIPEEKAQRVLQKVFDMNVMQFADGRRGAVNGMKPNGQLDDASLMSVEVWTGVTYALAATMLFEGMEEQAFQTAKGIYDTCYNEFGYGFQTPEAFLRDGAYRSLGYMRPLAVWAMEWAQQQKQQDR